MGQAEHSRVELLHEEFIRYVVNIRCKTNDWGVENGLGLSCPSPS